MNKDNAIIRIYFKGSRRPLKLTLPSRYTSDQWLHEVSQTLEDAEEVEQVIYSAAGDDPDAPS